MDRVPVRCSLSLAVVQINVCVTYERNIIVNHFDWLIAKFDVDSSLSDFADSGVQMLTHCHKRIKLFVSPS
jgi:hypothetical protein